MKIFRRQLQEEGPSLTFPRLCTSEHLGDLQWLAFVLIVLLVAGVSIVAAHAGDRSFDKIGALITVITAAALAALNWAYRSASRRIGAVDLFACEISVICRVSLVIDFATECVDQSRQLAGQDRSSHCSQSEAFKRFTGEEHYTPVYDKNLSDLEPLNVNVVTSVTEFYTYRKVMVDYLRAILAAADTKQCDDLWLRMIYMQFLMYESGRLAIDRLIEFEPNRAESKINILCSELVLYAYLCTRYEGTYQGARLQLRFEQYARIVPALCAQVRAAKHPSWTPAKTTLSELIRRYDAMSSAMGRTEHLLPLMAE